MQPAEVEVLYILPAIRRELAIEMKKLFVEQKKIAKLLCVTEAAVSQYLNSKRAAKVKFSKKAAVAIRKSAKKITTELIMISETQNLLKLMRDMRITCDIHEKLADIPEGCIVCFTSDEEQICFHTNSSSSNS